MKDNKLFNIIAYIIGFTVGIMIGAIIFWGLGNLFIYVFNIDYTWTIGHGFVCQFIYLLLKEIFGRR